MFWDQEEQPKDRQEIKLRGQKCGGQFGQFGWTARHNVDWLSEVQLTPADAQPILLTRMEKR